MRLLYFPFCTASCTETQVTEMQVKTATTVSMGGGGQEVGWQQEKWSRVQYVIQWKAGLVSKAARDFFLCSSISKAMIRCGVWYSRWTGMLLLNQISFLTLQSDAELIPCLSSFYPIHTTSSHVYPEIDSFGNEGKIAVDLVHHHWGFFVPVQLDISEIQCGKHACIVMYWCSVLLSPGLCSYWFWSLAIFELGKEWRGRGVGAAESQIQWFGFFLHSFYSFEFLKYVFYMHFFEGFSFIFVCRLQKLCLSDLKLFL